ncbi:MAG: AAA family ATPase [Sandaracinaceae bacterium]|nr:AAA family ATPase [Sandaracinaceae bacterium]
MIEWVEIQGFRAFRQLRMDGLTAVNLLVGANNSGKTALLEAIEAVASTDSPFPLYRASLERGEYARNDLGDLEIDVRHWFHGHKLEEGHTFELTASGGLRLRRSIQRVAAGEARRGFVPNGQMPTIERPGSRAALADLPLNADGRLGAGSAEHWVAHGLRLQPPVAFVTTDRLSPRELARLWARVELTGAEQRTLDAIRIIEPNLQRLAFSELAIGKASSPKALLEGLDQPVPLGTLGEGVTRMLTLALNLAVAAGGYLLIDELEQGLHWSAMPSLWRFVVSAAKELGVQIFATTHSKDCLEGLAELHRIAPELARRASVHRLSTDRESAVRFDAARIAEYVEMELEAR